MKVAHLTPGWLTAWISIGRRAGAAIGAICIAAGFANYANAANITMTTANVSWLNAATWSDTLAPSITNDYFTAVTGNNFLRTSPAGTTVGGNADFTGNSLTVVAGTKLLYKQVGGETASVNGGAGNATLDGQANAFNGIQFAPNGAQTGTTMTFDVSDLAVASDSTIESGGTTSNATVLIDGNLTGSGNLTLQRQSGGGNDTALNTTFSIASVGAYTGNLLVTRDTTLDFNSDHVFAGSLSLTDGPDLLTDLAILNVDQRLEFQSVLGGGTYVAPGSYSGAALSALNVTLGQTYFVDGGGTLVVRVPEPASIALFGLGALGTLGFVLRRRS
jgi:PEP-CTERM motif